MTREVIKNMPMNINFASDWLRSTIKDFAGKHKYSIGNVQIVWSEVSANPNATLSIEVTNDLQYKTVLSTHNINSRDNRQNTLMLSLSPGFKYFRFVYTANNVTTGWLTVIVNYE